MRCETSAVHGCIYMEPETLGAAPPAVHMEHARTPPQCTRNLSEPPRASIPPLLGATFRLDCRSSATQEPQPTMIKEIQHLTFSYSFLLNLVQINPKPITTKSKIQNVDGMHRLNNNNHIQYMWVKTHVSSRQMVKYFCMLFCFVLFSLLNTKYLIYTRTNPDAIKAS